MKYKEMDSKEVVQIIFGIDDQINDSIAKETQKTNELLQFYKYALKQIELGGNNQSTYLQIWKDKSEMAIPNTTVTVKSTQHDSCQSLRKIKPRTAAKNATKAIQAGILFEKATKLRRPIESSTNLINQEEHFDKQSLISKNEFKLGATTTIRQSRRKRCDLSDSDNATTDDAVTSSNSRETSGDESQNEQTTRIFKIPKVPVKSKQPIVTSEEDSSLERPVRRNTRARTKNIKNPVTKMEDLIDIEALKSDSEKLKLSNKVQSDSEKLQLSNKVQSDSEKLQLSNKVQSDAENLQLSNKVESNDTEFLSGRKTKSKASHLSAKHNKEANKISSALKKQAVEKAEQKRKEEEAAKKKLKEEEALKKKEGFMQAKKEALRRKREQNVQKVTATREAVEREKLEHLSKMEKEREEKERLLKVEAEKQKEQLLKKKQTNLLKAQEAEERRMKEENARLARLKEMEEEQKKQTELKIKQQEEAERLLQQRKMEEEMRQKELAKKGKLANANAKQGINICDEDEEYSIQDLKEQCESEDEDRPKKKIPEWASKAQRALPLMYQKHLSNMLTSNFFAGVSKKTPDLTLIFGKYTIKRMRTSSAVWLTPPNKQKDS